ncbi:MULTISPECIES: hypothetical protein [Bacillati]|uniref:hypothetical protein n=1 Tax=Bacillati TaxID=1783272 RepID=UPI0022B97415|nr:hypothetical protein [Caldifermentibacillus hisashii]
MSNQVKYIIKNEKSNEVYANGEFVETYDGAVFTLFETSEDAERMMESLDDNEDLEVYSIDVYENLWVHLERYTDLDEIPEDDVIIADYSAVITKEKYHEKAFLAEGYQTDFAGNKYYCVKK